MSAAGHCDLLLWCRVGSVGSIGVSGIFEMMLTLIVGFDPKWSTTMSKFEGTLSSLVNFSSRTSLLKQKHAKHWELNVPYVTNWAPDDVPTETLNQLRPFIFIRWGVSCPRYKSNWIQNHDKLGLCTQIW